VKSRDYFSLPDEELAELAAKGDSGAGDILYTRCKPRLLYIIRAFLTRYHRFFSSDEEEDLLGEIFTRIFRSLETYDAKKGKFFTWATTVAARILIDKERKIYSTMPSSPDGYPVEIESLDQPITPDSDRTIADTIPAIERDPFTVLKIAEIANDLLSAIEQVRNSYQQLALTLRFLCSFSLQEIADILSRPLSTIKSDLFRSIESVDSSLSVRWGKDADRKEIIDFGMKSGALFDEKDIGLLDSDVIREAMRLRVLEGKSTEEVSIILNCSASQVMGYLRQGISQLIAKGFRRRVKKLAPAPALSEKEVAERLCHFVDGLFIGIGILSEQTRNRRKMYTVLDQLDDTCRLLYLFVFRPLSGKYLWQLTLGSFVFKCASKLKIQLHDLAKEVGLDVHDFMGILIGRKKAKNSTIQALAEKLSRDTREIQALVTLAHTPQYHPDYGIRGRNNWFSFDRRMKKEINNIIRGFR